MARRKAAGKGSGQVPIELPPMDQGMVVTDLVRGVNYGLGSPGMMVLTTLFTEGNLRAVAADPKRFYALIDVDLPFCLPLDDEPYMVRLPDRRVIVQHRTKKRGEQEFSTFDASALPHFSTLQIQSEAFLDDPVPSEFDQLREERGGLLRSFVIILGVLKKFDTYLNQAEGIRLLGSLPKLSYRVRYFAKGDPPQKIAEAVNPYTAPVIIRGPKEELRTDNAVLRDFLSASLQVESFAERKTSPRTAGQSFPETVFSCVHDFGFFAKQQPEALRQLHEERIRDVQLLVFKTVFKTAEGEPYHFRGKLDFKVVNRGAPHEFVTGELKRWHGDKSAAEVFDQAVRVHATGQEAMIVCQVITDRKDPVAVLEKALEVFRVQEEFVVGSESDVAVPPGSFESWIQVMVRIRGREVPLRLGLIDLGPPTEAESDAERV